MQLRQYQTAIVTAIDHAWADQAVRNVIAVLPTGGGKTEVMGYMAKRHDDAGGYGIAMAHRSVLVGQLSLALAKWGVQHDIIASKKVVKSIVRKHMEKFGRSFFNPGARWKVASVDTMPGRAADHSHWISRVTLGFTDESHHVLAANKWGKECLRFTNPLMRWLLPTATPERADGQGLGEAAQGIAHKIVEGPSPRWLIDNGYLTNYVVRAPIPADLDLSTVTIGANGEYNLQQLRRAVHQSGKILGNVVDTYLRFTPGKLGIAFAVDIEHATALTKEFNDKGVRAELITADHDEDQRDKILRRYEQRETLVLVNVDLFGEGFDLPAIEVVMMVRPTASYSLYAQQWGRGLRLSISAEHMARWDSYAPALRRMLIAASSKTVCHIHDHVGNIIHFNGPPDKPRDWNLNGRRRGVNGAIPMRVCLNPTCLQPFERFYSACPYCHAEVPAPMAPTLPEQVDGDITLYTSDMMQKLFGVSTVAEAMAVVPDTFCRIPTNAPSMAAVRAISAAHHKKLAQQGTLAQLIPLTMPPSLPLRDAQRRFYHMFGVDVVSARLLGGVETEALNEKITLRLTEQR